MNPAQTDTAHREPLRLWPGVTIVALQWFLAKVVPRLVPGTPGGMIGAFGGLFGGLLVLVWWAFFSRATRAERWGGALLMVVVPFAVRPILHESIASGGMGMLYPVYAVPILCLALVGWAIFGRRLADGPRRAALVATLVVAVASWGLVRSDGVSAKGADFAWRWSQTAEERLLAEANEEPTALRAAGLTLGAEVVWPGFRGPKRDGVIPGVRVETDWSKSPPVELWRRSIGPGWSSFAVYAGLLFTQEQRGEEEVVACYEAATGEPVWRYRHPARFWEPEGGAGPRGTPTAHDGRVYAFGATGTVSALNAADGSLAWSRDAVADADVEPPHWGFSSSPLVVGNVVIVAVAGRLVAYDLATGDPRWLGPDGGVSYSSPHRLRIDGVDQVVLLSAAGATSVAPADGTVLWDHSWPGFSIVQPALTAEGDLLLGADQVGTTRISVARQAGGWTVEERWTSNRLKSNFNDFVVHKGHAYGFDGSILASIDLADGARNWKGGRYGQGQLVLLPDQDVLLVISEESELALVSATPDGFAELARFSALDGKTWNHPVLVGDRLFIRNGQEMAAFRLVLTGS